MRSHEDELTLLEEALRKNLAAPTPDTPAFLEECGRRLRAVPVSVAPKRRIAVLIDIASQYYLHGQKVFSAIEPIALAVMLAEQEGDRPLLRKSLNIQGTILGATNNVTDAIASLLRSLDLAEELGEQIFIVATWINIALAFMEATLFTDARLCYERAFAKAASLPDNSTTRNVAAKALHGSALCSLRLHEYVRGLDSIEEAIALLDEPVDRDQEQARVLAEATYVRLLLATNRVEEGAGRVPLALEMAERSRSLRASLAAATTRGLVEVYSGKHDLGLSRIASAIENARALPGSLYETLHTAVLAQERAGRADRAMSTHRELMMRMRKANQEAIEQHQRLHLQRLSLPEPDAAGLEALETTDEKLKNNLVDLAAKQYEFLEQMAMRVELREEPKGQHAFRVAMWAQMLAIEADMPEAEAAELEQAARLHDIGKVVIPDSVILKKTALSSGERQIIETHAANGADLLARSKMPYARLAEEIARYHHEHWDGGGYPEQLAGNAIPLAARIVGLCDAFDAMVHDRVFRRAYTMEEALGQIARERERQFDPKLVDLFIPLVRRIYREHRDVNAFLARVAETASLSSVRRSVEERASRSELDEDRANEQPRQQQQARFRRSSEKPN
jgi:putative two-component system response regulator